MDFATRAFVAIVGQNGVLGALHTWLSGSDARLRPRQ
jgi:hypothetical protein